MKRKFPLLRTLCFLLFATVICVSQQRLFVVGGGERPNDGMKKFVEWSGGRSAKVLIITWASGVPDQSFTSLEKHFSQFENASVVHAPTRPLDAEKRAKFIEQLDLSTGVFFSGGDQNRIMDVLADEELLKLIRQKYARGTPFGGTSAGAAVISDPMMTGDADLKVLDGAKVGVRRGLGLVPNVMFDQHFLVRQRHNRLIGFVIRNPAYIGVGIDEDTAVLIEDNRKLTVVGTSQVMLLNAKEREAIRMNILKSGARYDLKKRKTETK
ncbi:MAG: cyanophycinase [Pyrinomonadaceae bacterium]